MVSRTTFAHDLGHPGRAKRDPGPTSLRALAAQWVPARAAFGRLAGMTGSRGLPPLGRDDSLVRPAQFCSLMFACSTILPNFAASAVTNVLYSAAVIRRGTMPWP